MVPPKLCLLDSPLHIVAARIWPREGVAMISSVVPIQCYFMECVRS